MVCRRDPCTSPRVPGRQHPWDAAGIEADLVMEQEPGATRGSQGLPGVSQGSNCSYEPVVFRSLMPHAGSTAEKEVVSSITTMEKRKMMGTY